MAWFSLAKIAVQAGTKSFKNIIDVLKDSKYFENKNAKLDMIVWHNKE